MKLRKAEQNWLVNPEIFEVNREPAHSDHLYFEDEESAQKSEMGLRQSLNGVWKFSYAENPAQRKSDFYRLDYDTSEFDEIKVPGHIQTQGYDKCQYINTMYPWDGQEELRPPHISDIYNPVGSYVKNFTVNEKLRGKKLFISFQGVETAFYVWLNGSFIGYSEDSFTPAEFELTDFLAEGENKLAVEVYKRSSASWLEDQDFWRFSGIFREVYLYAVPETHVRDLFFTGSLDDTYTKGLFTCQAELEGETDCTAELCIKDEYGSEIYRMQQKGAKKMAWEGCADKIQSWSAEIPCLYKLELRIYGRMGKLTEIVQEEVGFRRFEMKKGVMHLNGHRIIFRGINRHEFCAERGRSVTMDDMLWDIRFLKQHNINAVRTSHYPNETAWYRLCDKYGIYLIDEANLESHGSWQKLGACEPSWNVPGSLPEWEACVVDRARSMLERDKNHPSILIWSCGNESYAGRDILKMAEYFRERDKSRLVHYEGVFWNREFDEISDMESRMYAKPAEIKSYLDGHPKKPYISCEYMHAMGNSCGGMCLYTELEDRYEQYQGGFIWDYIDQALYRTNEQGEKVLSYGGDFDDRATDYEFCGNGIVSADRRPTPKAQEVKALYADIRLKPDESGVEIENRNCFKTTEGIRFVYRLLYHGVCKFEGSFQADIEPLSKQYVKLAYPRMGQPGEYVYEVTARLASDTMWAEAGHETAFGQYVSGTWNGRPEKTDGKMQIIHGDVNIGVKGEGFSIQFSRAEGGLSSLCYGGTEYITRKPKTVFWRALTNNDRGAGYGYDCAQWMGAGLFQKLEDCSVEEDEGTVSVRFIWGLPTTPKAKANVRYTVYPTGCIRVESQFCGQKNLPQLPVFGMDFQLKARYHEYRFYGYGPEENYVDRVSGARLGIFESTAKETMEPYLVPQECGSHMGTRWLEVSDGSGRGLRFVSEDSPFVSSVLPYSAYELEQAAHQEELPTVHYTWVRLLAFQMGVGGDDSWGAPVHEPYRYSSESDRSLVFWIEKQ